MSCFLFGFRILKRECSSPFHLFHSSRPLSNSFSFSNPVYRYISYLPYLRIVVTTSSTTAVCTPHTSTSSFHVSPLLLSDRTESYSSAQFLFLYLLLLVFFLPSPVSMTRPLDRTAISSNNVNEPKKTVLPLFSSTRSRLHEGISTDP